MRPRPPPCPTNHEAPSASPASIIWVGLAGPGSSSQLKLREAGGVPSVGRRGPLALQGGTRRVVAFDLWPLPQRILRCKPSKREVSWEKVPGKPKAPMRIFSGTSIPGTARSYLLLLVHSVHATEHRQRKVLWAAQIPKNILG